MHVCMSDVCAGTRVPCVYMEVGGELVGVILPFDPWLTLLLSRGSQHFTHTAILPTQLPAFLFGDLSEPKQ